MTSGRIKIGDKVEVISIFGGMYGKIGTVVDIDASSFLYKVDFPSRKKTLWFCLHELRKYEAGAKP